MSDFLNAEVRDDFNRARKRAFFTEIFGLFGRTRDELLSLHEVREYLRPRGETYRGLQTIPVDLIVGSEGRYGDFTRQFLPRHDHLRGRWQRVDMAHHKDVILPPIALYEINGVYFVRDGNHRVSVARAQGVQEIDAEVVTLTTEVPLTGELTRDGLRNAVIAYEEQLFRRKLQIDKILPDADLKVTATGRFDALVQHIYGHKYYLNECSTVEIPLERAICSWYEHVYTPIVVSIRSNGVLARFPDRTETDLYLWIVHHWDELKHRWGQDFGVEDAVRDYATRYGAGRLRRALRRVVGALFGRPPSSGEER